MTAKEKAQASLSQAAQDERTLAESYKRAFSTPDGKRVLADLRAIFPHDRARFDAGTSFANPIAAIIGGVHFDGSAAVISRILGQIEIANQKPQPPPTIETA